MNLEQQSKAYLSHDSGEEIPIIYNTKKLPKDMQKHIALKEQETGQIWGIVPVISMPDDADYRWQLGALMSRLEHPVYYEANEDVAAVTERLKQWLSDYEDKHPDIKAKRIAGHYNAIIERHKRYAS